MKEISIFIHTDDLKKVTEILRKYNVVGMSFYHIEGAGESKQEAIPEMVRSYMTGRTIIPEQHLAMHVQRTKVETFVLDSQVKQIVDDILNSLNPGTNAHGIIVIKDVADIFEIGTEQRGEAVLSK